MKIFVAGLPFAVSDSELQELFEPYGTVGSAKVILDRETHKSRGFGFVEFSSNEEAEKAILSRIRELFVTTTDHIEEDVVLDDALYALRALRSCVHSEVAAA